MLQPEQLQCVPIFASLERAQLAQLVALATEERYGVGHHIFAEGDRGTKLYLLLDGRVRISKFIPGIGEEALAILNAGSYFGEMALIDQSPRSAHAIAHSDVVLGAIESSAFEQLLFVNRDLAYDVLWNFVRTLSARLRETNDKIKSFFAMSGGF
ncbi:MAG: cyclic nucleotide-binding domain-containing protein [Deltaproteobacteria bacterium]|nr:cyclic nucleotide-binding domain-containing protein [Deltaproteobacteria bacterium]